MQSDPILEMQRLAAHYRELSDNELRDLAVEFADLTETAQQALRTEMQSRGLRGLEAPKTGAPPANEIQQSQSIPRKNFDLLAGPLANSYVVPSDPSEQNKEDSEEDNSRIDYTWKTLLCECNEVTDARQLSEALKRAGIQNWIEALPGYSIGIGSPRVLVAADQLDQARAVAAQPIPRQIVEDAQTEIPDYQPPTCPKCGAPDPILEGVDPTNSWQCEQCGQHWVDPISPDPATP
jgi:hypothetical protein